MGIEVGKMGIGKMGSRKNGNRRNGNYPYLFNLIFSLRNVLFLANTIFSWHKRFFPF